MAYPVTINGRTYTLADFEGTNYVDGFPDALEDFVTQAGDIYNSTSTSSVAIGTGSKTFTTADSDKPYQAGTPLRIADAAAPETNFMDCIVTSYSGTTLVVDAFGFAGSGTKSSWTINIGGAKTVDGTLAIAQGGTGATTASDAADNLGLGTTDAVTFGSATISGDASVNGLTVGRGAGNVSSNTASGVNALASNTTGCFNTASGTSALFNNTIGSCNTASGSSALLCNTTGNRNTASGTSALVFNTTGTNNTASGVNALRCNTEGNCNTASGTSALFNNTIGSCNTASGLSALFCNTEGVNNTANGAYALFCNTTGNNNTASGINALYSNTTGSCNTASGLNPLFCNTTGSNNIGIGYNAGRTGCSPLAITTASNQVVIGNNDHNCFVARCAWVTSSDCRDKTDIAPTVYGLDFVRALQPVEYKWDARFRYGYDEESGQYGTPDGSKKDSHCSIGFLAQQVLEIEKQTAPDRKPIIVSEDDPESLLLAETRIIPALVRAVQELTDRLEALENA